MSKFACDPNDHRCTTTGAMVNGRWVCDRHRAKKAQKARTEHDGYPLFRRAGGGVVCGTCKKPYSDHPLTLRWLDWDGDPWLNELCGGELVKL